eukprot:1138073-Pelagomonas_calceolata.AAC.2
MLQKKLYVQATHRDHHLLGGLVKGHALAMAFVAFPGIQRPRLHLQRRIRDILSTGDGASSVAKSSSYAFREQQEWALAAAGTCWHSVLLLSPSIPSHPIRHPHPAAARLSGACECPGSVTTALAYPTAVDQECVTAQHSILASTGAVHSLTTTVSHRCCTSATNPHSRAHRLGCLIAPLPWCSSRQAKDLMPVYQLLFKH